MSRPQQNPAASGSQNTAASGKRWILLVDDQREVCDGLRKYIETEEDLAVSGAVADSRALWRAIREQPPDLVIMDIALGPEDGLNLTRELQSGWFCKPVLIFSVHSDLDFALEALRAGASGYLMKQDAADHLLRAIRKVLKGRLFLSAAVREALMHRCDDYPGDPAPPLNRLSAEERKVVRLYGLGVGLHHISCLLDLTVERVTEYLINICHRLEIDDLAVLRRDAALF